MSAPKPVNLTRIGLAGAAVGVVAFVTTLITVKTETGWLGWVSWLLLAATGVILMLWTIAVGVSWGVRHARSDL